jgi:SAM-dependent methyltransferase
MPSARRDSSAGVRVLTTDEARAFYDRFGERQDAQAFYEDPAVDVLIARADFPHARSVLEFGCGTGRLAARLLGTVLPEECRYVGLDVSATMVALARERVRPWASRADVVQSDGSIPPQCERPYDRFVSTFVLDLLSDDAIATVLADAHRLLVPDGRLCVVGLTHGQGPVTRLVSSAWALVHRLKPSLVGGCRPLAVHEILPTERWRIVAHETVSAWSITSEVLVAAPRVA